MKDNKIIIAASIVGIALVVLAHSLSRVAVEVAKASQESSQLVERLEDLSNNIPKIADEAGEVAGRSAVNGAVDQAISEPMELFRGISQSFRRQDSKSSGNESDGAAVENPRPTESIIKIEFIEPSVVFEIGTDPSKFIRWGSEGSSKGAPSSTDPSDNTDKPASSLADSQE